MCVHAARAAGDGAHRQGARGVAAAAAHAKDRGIGILVLATAERGANTTAAPSSGRTVMIPSADDCRLRLKSEGVRTHVCETARVLRRQRPRVEVIRIGAGDFHLDEVADAKAA